MASDDEDDMPLLRGGCFLDFSACGGGGADGLFGSSSSSASSSQYAAADGGTVEMMEQGESASGSAEEVDAVMVPKDKSCRGCLRMASEPTMICTGKHREWGEHDFGGEYCKVCTNVIHIKLISVLGSVTKVGPWHEL